MKTISISQIGATNMAICKRRQILPEQTAIVVNDVAKDFNTIAQFVGSEPTIKIEHGQVVLKLKGHKTFGNGSVIIKTGSSVEKIVSLQQFENEFDIIKVESIGNVETETNTQPATI